MDFQLDWLSPVSLKKNTDHGQIYSCDLDAILDSAGVYIFGRSFGANFEALYVGIATSSVRIRIKQQFNNLRLMSYLKAATNGPRILHIGQFKAKQGQQPRKCLRIIERSLIRHFLEEGHQLVNIQGTKIRTHKITSTGNRLNVPETMYVDKK